jgi:TonB family protein
MIEIPGYTVLRLLGHGGMATVYLAQQKSLGREVALKILIPALASDPVATERFLREARVSAKLHHPNIVAIFDVGVHEGVPYMSIAYEPGGTVAGSLQARSDPKVALRIIRDIATALDYAHRQGVIHRDVKPENILLRHDGTCVLSDFGIAHAFEAQTGLTREGTSVGTPHYMSPEQLRGEHVDARADIYSLGVVLFQLLTGELPYQGTDGWAIGMQHISAPIPHLPSHLDYLQTFLDALLAKDPSRRLQSGAEVVQWVDARLSGSGPALTVAMPTPMPSFAPTPPGARGAASIAILPFADLSQTKDQEYLADGLTEELLNLLAKTPGLFVASRSAAARFKGSTAKLAEIGRELKVATVLEGSVRKFGDRVRISVQLINVVDGFQRWSETYDRTLVDVFAVQDEIAALVLIALKEQLLPDLKAAEAGKLAQAAQAEAAAKEREREAAELKQREEAEKAAAEERRQREIGERILAKKREREEAERLAAEKLQREEAERAAAELQRIAEEKRLAAEREQREREERAAEAQRQREAAERAQAERLAAEREQREREERAAEAQRQREAAERAEAERLAAVRAEAERVAAERAEAERLAAERAAAERAQAERAAAERAAAERAQAERAAAERAAAERAAAEQRRREDEARAAAEAKRQAEAKAAAERKQREEAEAAAAAERKREAEQRAAAERDAAQARAQAEREALAQRQREEHERAEAQRRQREQAEQQALAQQQREQQQRADAERDRRDREAAERERAAAAALVTGAANADASTEAAAADADEEPARDPARDFASAYLSKPTPAAAHPAAPAASASASNSPFTPARIGMALGALLVLAVGGWLLMQNLQQKNQVACQAALLQGQGAADAADFDQAATAALTAHGVCADDVEPILSALDARIKSGQALAQSCGAASTRARELLRAGHPKSAAEALAPTHADCASWPGYPELEALPVNSQAQARELVRRAQSLFKSGATSEANTLAEQAVAMDADSEGLAELRKQLAKKLGSAAPAAEAPPPAPAPTAVPPPPTPVPPTKTAPAPAPGPDTATAAAAEKAAAEKAAKERAAKLAEEKARKAEEKRAAAAAAAKAAPAPAAPAPAAPTPPAPAAAPAPAPAGRGNALVAISSPQPPYPTTALRGKLRGEVTVSFTVNADGSVSGVRVVSSKPRGVFDRAVTGTVAHWRFQPIDQPQSTTRTITFEP